MQLFSLRGCNKSKSNLAQHSIILKWKYDTFDTFISMPQCLNIYDKFRRLFDTWYAGEKRRRPETDKNSRRVCHRNTASDILFLRITLIVDKFYYMEKFLRVYNLYICIVIKIQVNTVRYQFILEF